MNQNIRRNWNNRQISENSNKKEPKHIKKQFTNYKKYSEQKYLK